MRDPFFQTINCERPRLIEVGASCFNDPGYCHTKTAVFPKSPQASTMEFAKQHKNITVKADPFPVFKNITYSVIEKTAVIVSKNKYPTIHFIIHHKKMINAFCGFMPPIKESDIPEST